MRVKIKRLNKDAKVPFKTHEKDFCYDVVATSRVELAVNVFQYGIGLAFEIMKDDITNDLGYPEDYIFNLEIRPRSSIWKTGMMLSNSIGTIDELYRGEVKLTFYHLLWHLPIYEVGDKIAQIVVGVTDPISFQVVEELSDTIRGEGAFGSTGK